MVPITFQHASDLDTEHCVACLGCWGPITNAAEYLKLHEDLMLDRLPGAASSCPLAVADPAWLGSQCWVKYTSMPSGMAVCTVLLHAACLLCSQSATSLECCLSGFQCI